MTPYELYQQARLDDAIGMAVDQVKKKPVDANGRLMLCDLLCLKGDFERADKQLDVLSKQDAELSVGIRLYRNLIRAEKARTQFYDQGRIPEFMENVSNVLQLHLRASIAVREGAMLEARNLIEQAEQERRPLSGICDTEAFGEFRDLDDLTSPFLEVLTSTGKYYWVELERIESIEFRQPAQLRDLIWRPAGMTIFGGADAVVYVPVLYAGTRDSEDPEVRIGRGTHWIENADGPTRGVGQRMFLVDETDRSIMSIHNIAINHEPVNSP